MLILFFNGSTFSTRTWWFQWLVTCPRQPKLPTLNIYYYVNRIAVERKFRGIGFPDHLQRSGSWWTAISIAISSEERHLTATYVLLLYTFVFCPCASQTLLKSNYNIIGLNILRIREPAKWHSVFNYILAENRGWLIFRSRCPKFRACMKKNPITEYYTPEMCTMKLLSQVSLSHKFERPCHHLFLLLYLDKETQVWYLYARFVRTRCTQHHKLQFVSSINFHRTLCCTWHNLVTKFMK